MGGVYCPVGVARFRKTDNSIVYKKEAAATAQDTFYLTMFTDDLDEAHSSCAAGKWILYQVDPLKDIVAPDKGIFEFHGTSEGCVDDEAVSLALMQCGQPVLEGSEEDEGEEKA